MNISVSPKTNLWHVASARSRHGRGNCRAFQAGTSLWAGSRRRRLVVVGARVLQAGASDKCQPV